jgi:hypothetical protein
MPPAPKPSRTKLDCPQCKQVVPCPAVTKNRKGQHGRVSWPDAKDIIWFRRKRKCSACGYEFVTAELDARFLDELRLLRGESAKQTIKHETELKSLRDQTVELKKRIAELRKLWFAATNYVLDTPAGVPTLNRGTITSKSNPSTPPP